jgi:hypothetical protein
MRSATNSAGEVSGRSEGSSPPEGTALLLACPVADLRTAGEVHTRFGLVLLPAGALGDLDRCDHRIPLYLVEITEDGARPAATWNAQLVSSVRLADPSPDALLPPSWCERHPDAYARARGLTPYLTSADQVPVSHQVDDAPGHERDDGDDNDDSEVKESQVFIPVANLVELPQPQWLFTNELVSKQARGGRRFAPRAPTLVTIPD